MGRPWSVGSRFNRLSMGGVNQRMCKFLSTMTSGTLMLSRSLRRSPFSRLCSKLRAQLVVHGVQFFVGGLQFFLGGIQLFIGGLRLFVGRP